MSGDATSRAPPYVSTAEKMGVHHEDRSTWLASRRFADRIDSVVVRLVDLNGPKGGRDKRCRMAARLSISAPNIVVEAIDADAYLAVSHAAARLDEQITRVVARSRRRAATGASERDESRRKA